MFGLVMTLFLQAAGPVTSPATPAIETPAVTEAATTEETVAAEEEAEQQRRRRCSQRSVTGSRLSHVVRCRTREGYQDQDTQDTMHSLQRPDPAQAG